MDHFAHVRIFDDHFGVGYKMSESASGRAEKKNKKHEKRRKKFHIN